MDEAKLALVAARVGSVGLVTARKGRKKKPKKSKGRRTKKKTPPQKKPEKRSRNTVPEPDITKPPTEFSCRSEISVTVDFEGNTSRGRLLNALKREIKTGIDFALTSISRSHQLGVSNKNISITQTECAVVDSSTVEDELDELDDELDV